MDGGNSSRGGTPNPQAGNSNSQGGSSSSSRWVPSIANLLNPIADNSNFQPENSNRQVGNSNTNTNQNPNPNPNPNQNPSPNPSNDGENTISRGDGYTVNTVLGGLNVRYNVDNPTNIRSIYNENGVLNRSEENRRYARRIYNALTHYSILTNRRVNFPHLDDNTYQWYKEFVQRRNPNAVNFVKNSKALKRDILTFSEQG